MRGPAARAPDGTSPDVLIVEDHFFSADALRLMFEAAGYRVRLAASAEEAIAACAAQRPDLMLLDLSLPDGDGLDVLARTATAGTTPRVTAALTGHDRADIVTRCRQAGCVAVLLKPVTPGTLLVHAAEWLV
jgi:CheY-like chemotaxis protein